MKIRKKSHRHLLTLPVAAAMMLFSGCGDSPEQAVKKLINQGVISSALDVKSETGGKAVLDAVSKNNTAILKILLDAGADANAKDTYGITALMFASEKGHDTCVKLLLDAGADANAKDNNGRTALKSASEKGYDACVKLLKAAGAKEVAGHSTARSARGG